MSMITNAGYPSAYGTSGLGQAVQSGLTLTNGIASLGNLLLQSLQSGASVVNPQAAFGQPNGLGNSPVAGLLQSVVQLLQAVGPLLQALGSRMQPNQSAMQFSNQLGGFGNPQFGNPQFGNPQLGNPQFGNPTYGNPQYGNQQYGNQPYSNLTSFSVNMPAQFGNMSPQAALGWVQAYGGPNVQQSDVTQGMNLYSIFNSGSRMF